MKSSSALFLASLGSGFGLRDRWPIWVRVGLIARGFNILLPSLLIHCGRFLLRGALLKKSPLS